MNEKKTKIICTVSDWRCSVEFLRSLYENGMNVIRINSAHASLEGASMIVDNVRKVSDRIAILIDTKGPEVRLTSMNPAAGFDVKAGDTICFQNGEDKESSREALYTNCRTFVQDVPVGARILIDDASIEMVVTEREGGKLKCRICNNGVIKGKKGINVPNVNISLPALTDKDRRFIRWAIEKDIDFIAHSFVQIGRAHV